MPTIRMTTVVAAPLARVFDLSRSVALEEEAASRWKVRATGGVTRGLLGEGQRVIWRGRQFGMMQEHHTLMESVRAPYFFRDVMESGSFRRFAHDHHFATMNGGTRVRDELRFEVGWGPLGRMAEGVVWRRLVQLLEARNELLRTACEGEGWRQYLAVPEVDATRTAATV